MRKSKTMADSNEIKSITILVPVYNEEESLPNLYARVTEEMGKLDYLYDILFIDDGSRDQSVPILNDIIEKDPRVSLIVMRRNFGKSEALGIAFREVKGDVVITMDADLQDEPSEISRFIEKIEEGYDLVSGWKQERKDPLTKVISSKFFNGLTSFLSGIKLHDFNCGFKAYRNEVTKCVDVYGELHRFIPALAHQEGFSVCEIPVKHNAREFGESKYGRLGLKRFINFLLDPINVLLLTKYTKKPIHFFGLAGVSLFFVGFIIGTYLTFIKFYTGTFQGRYPLLMLVGIMIVVGVQLIIAGLLGEMMSKNFVNDEKNARRISKRSGAMYQ